MKKLLFLVTVSATLFLGACSSSDEQAVTAKEAFDADKAKADYKVCASCHGADLQGGTGGAGLDRPITGLTKEAVLQAIQEGPGNMPKGMVKDERAENLAAWIAAQ